MRKPGLPEKETRRAKQKTEKRKRIAKTKKRRRVAEKRLVEGEGSKIGRGKGNKTPWQAESNHNPTSSFQLRRCIHALFNQSNS